MGPRVPPGAREFRDRHIGGTGMTGPKRITANGVDFAYMDAGSIDRPLALCLHGFPDHAPTYQYLLPALADAGFHAVAPWTRGYSPTALAPDGNYQTASLALDALALADALAPKRSDAVLVGHDWGALTAYCAAAYRPERFTKLVTMAVPPSGAVAGAFASSAAQLQRSWYVFVFQTGFAEGALTADDFAMVDLLWKDWSPGFVPEAKFMRALKDTLGAPGSTEAAIEYYRFMFGTSKVDPVLDAVQDKVFAPVPVDALYLHGADDGCMAAELFDESTVRPWFSGELDFHVLPDSGHFLHVEHPEVVNPLIVDFLSRKPDKSM
ncbi:MAG: putative hydrolase or acyltransferase of alpha/beta superfamily [Actinomycetia bacterium]|nr:putative hydrolase or acyltransferase of alpha/beta superfamily [Actinomycetes bacterium]